MAGTGVLDSGGAHGQAGLTADLGRRRALGLMGAGLASALSGCCCPRGFPTPAIGPAPPPAATPLLRTDRINKSLTRDVFCVDAHAHFFNASDVTVRGYLEGPVAHAAGDDVGRLFKLLAPVAEELAFIAPRADQEYEYLAQLSSRAALVSPSEMERAHQTEMADHRQRQSRQFFDLLKTRRGRPFAEEYERVRARRNPEALATGGPPMIQLDEQALVRAMTTGETPRSAEIRSRALPGTGGVYAEGVLAFVGYMLSYRWHNLRSYYEAFSAHPEALGVDRVLGALVDFDRWLDCPPRSAHEDQMRVHARMSELSGGYMRPLIGYNPWTDVADGGRSLRLVKQAVKDYRFVGVKIYPPNGFRPWGNTAAQDGPGLPSHADINARLQALWDACLELDVPVMAHANRSMGKDAAHDILSEPSGWAALLDAYAAQRRSPRVSLGHFGGDSAAHGGDWTERMAQLMARDNGKLVFGDLGYWAELRCADVGPDRCAAAVRRLLGVLRSRLAGPEGVADRVMFGSDWLMLSRERHWADYATELFNVLKTHAPEHVERIFGANALRCFSSLRPPA